LIVRTTAARAAFRIATSRGIYAWDAAGAGRPAVSRLRRQSSAFETTLTLENAICADICETSAAFMMRRPDLHGRICAVCAETCQRCAENCRQMSTTAA